MADGKGNTDGIARFLRRAGLIGDREEIELHPLTGGVSSDIWKVVRPDGGAFCVKRALARLKVSAEWNAPTERNRYEARWMQHAASIIPSAVPRLLAHDEEYGALAMEYLEPGLYPLWKAELLAGRVEPAVARALGTVLGRIHAATAGRSEVAADFDTDDIFFAIRLEPYFIAAGEAHPDLAGTLQQLVRDTAATRLALVHGDVSPKNILCGPDGPVLLDAECAWYGDPAFDLAFCLCHLLLKTRVRPDRADALLECFDALTGAYLAQAIWERREVLEGRSARLLAGFLLARVDGKSPVEYLAGDGDKDFVRAFARRHLLAGTPRLAELRADWKAATARRASS